MDICLILVLFAFLLLLIVLLHLNFQQSHNAFRKRSKVAIDEGRTELFDEIIDALHCSPTDLIIIIFSHNG